MKRLVILGSGPAGLTAAIYAARGGLKVTVVSGPVPGGQLTLTNEVENYPGFSEPVLGSALMNGMRLQAEKFGAKFVEGIAEDVDFKSRPFKVKVNGQVIEGDAVIIATGSSPKKLGLKSEERLRGRGVSYCAVCDGPLFKGKEVVVVGGGDTAVEDAIFLTKFASKVTIIHRRDRLRATKIIQDRAFANKKISFIWDSVVIEVLGKEKVEGVKIKNVKSGNISKLRCDGIFIAIGYKPNTDFLKGKLELDKSGYIIKKGETETSVKGVFVAGDVADYKYRQAITAAADGCKAAIDVSKYLEEGN
jgi:thioredoxin reductase (NADPH)